IKPTIDSTTGQSFRAIVSMRDFEREAEAKSSLIHAALRLKDNADVQTETLRMVVMHTPTNVALLEKICLQMVAIDAQDTRANYQLANYHYEQPAQDAKGGQGPPLPLDKRSLKRMLEARTYLEATKKSTHNRYWRTTDLEVRIALWLRDYYDKQSKAA